MQDQVRSDDRDTFESDSRGAGATRAVRRSRRRDLRFDGHFVGSDHTVAPGSRKAITPFYPRQGTTSGREMIYEVNGIWTDRAGQMGELQALANASGHATVGVHNSTQGALVDGLETVLENRLLTGNEKATRTLTGVVLQSLDDIKRKIDSGRAAEAQPVHLAGYSQGAAITAHALWNVKNALLEEHAEEGRSRSETEREVESFLHDWLKVETFGGAAGVYPNGPKYIHYLTENDVVPLALGVTGFFGRRPMDGRAGENAIVVQGKRAKHPHYFDVYMRMRRDFDTLYDTDFTHRRGKYAEIRGAGEVIRKEHRRTTSPYVKLPSDFR